MAKHARLFLAYAVACAPVLLQQCVGNAGALFARYNSKYFFKLSDSPIYQHVKNA